MSNVIQLFAELKKRDIKLTLDGEKLKVNAPTGALTNEIKQALKAQKDDILAFLKQAQAEQSDKSDASLPVVDRNQALPLTHQQQRLWFLDQIQPGLSAYNMPMAVRIKGRLNEAAMQQTFANIVKRHEVLRTTFTTAPGQNEGEPFLVFHDADFWSWQVDDHSQPGADEARINAQAARLAEVEADSAFDLAEGPLFRVRLVKLAKDDHVLLVTMHHTVSDGWSLDVVMKEIGIAYAAYSAGLEPQQPELSIQYADFAHWQRQWLASAEHTKQLNYWSEKLRGCSKLIQLPTDRPRGSQQSFAGDVFNFALPSELSQQLKQFCQQENITLFMLLLSAYQLVLSRYSGQNDVNVGIPSAGRTRKELEELIGFFVNVLVMRGDTSGNCSVRELLARTKATTLGAFAHEQIPMELIIEALDVEWNPAYPPLAQVGFALQNAASIASGGQTQNTGGLQLSGIEAERHSAKYDFILFISEGDEGLSGSVEYNTDLYDQATIARLTQHFERVLSQFVRAPEQNIDQIELFEPAELADLLGANGQIGAEGQNIERILPLTPTQNDLYLSHVLNPDTLDNSMGQIIDIPGEIDAEQLRNSLQQLSDRYAMLRSCLLRSPLSYTDLAYWCVKTQHRVNFQVLDWSHEQLNGASFHQRLTQRLYQPYQLKGKDADDLVRFELVIQNHQHCALLLLCNHIALDGVAMSFVSSQALKLLEGADINALPEDNYADFIQSSQAQFDRADNINYWREQFGRTEPLDFMLGQPEAGNQPALSNKLVSKYHRIDAATLEQVGHYAKSQGISVGNLLKGLYGLLINNYCRPEEDFYIRETRAGRGSSGSAFADSIGPCHQMVPFLFRSCHLKGSHGIQDLVADINTFNAERRPFSALSLVTQNQLAPQGRIGFMFNFYHFDNRIEMADRVARITTHAPLELQGQVQLIIHQEDAELQLAMHYQNDVFADHHLLERLESLCQQLINGVDRVDQLNFLLAEEERTLATFNPSLPAFEQFPVHQRFEHMAAQFGERIAVVCEDQELSYAQLNARANQLARELVAQGIDIGSFVGLCLERSTDLMVGILGILKAGAAYVPLDPHFPSDRLAFILEDSQAQVLVSHSDVADTLASFTGKTITLDADSDTIAAHPQDNLNLQVPLDSTIYVLYTSGTTGKPKGCLVSHANVARLFSATDADFGFNENDVWTLFHSYAFDFTVWEMWGALLFGGKLVVVPYLVSRAPDEFYQLLIDQKVSSLSQTPSAFSQLIALDASQPTGQLALKTVVFGGEALDFNALHTWVDRHGLDQPKLVNMYGITETTVHVTRHTLSQADFAQAGLSNVGTPIRDLHVHIIDSDQRATPIGIPGELVVSGAGVTHGYLKRDDLSAEKFISNPFCAQLAPDIRQQHERLYRSGDLARFMPNGDIEYLGRIDQQVKIRGHRIELGEIEAQMAALDSVREAVVLALGEAEDKRLVGYILLPQGQTSSDLATIRQQLSLNLPDYMIPGSFVSLAQWPLTPTGKVDKKALPAPDGDHLHITTAYVEPRSETERQIATLWQDLLGVEQVGILDNFFELGGHSLLATRAVARIKDLFSTDIALRQLFEAPTVEGMARLIDGDDMMIEQTPIVAVDRSAYPDGLPLSYAQQRLWLIDQLQPGSPMYNIPVAFRLSGKVNVQALQDTFAAIVTRHESLRTTFSQADQEPKQFIHPATDEYLINNSLRIKQAPANENLLRSQIAEFLMTPFGLQHGPLFKAELWQLSEGEETSQAHDYVLLISVHHSVFDGWSMNVLLSELGALYQAFDQNQPSPLAPLAIQYADYALWQREWLQGEELDQQVDYWRQQLAHVPLLELPTDRPRGATLSPVGRLQDFEIGPELSAKLRHLSQQHGATLFMTLMSAFQTLLHRYSGQEDICVGTPIANRTQSDLEPLIGFFVNTLAIRSYPERDMSFSHLLNNIKETTLGAYGHQDVSFEKLIDELKIPRDLSHTPLFQAMFMLQNTGDAKDNKDTIQLGDMQLGQVFADDGEFETAAKFDLTLTFTETGDRLKGVMEYRTALFDPETITRLLQHFELLLEGICATPERAIGELPMLTEQERQQLLVDWNQTVTDYPRDSLIHELIENSAQRYPDSTAVTFYDQQLNYRELNERANQLAHYLVSQGAQTDTLVGVCLERSADMIISLIAVLKAGCAYVPIDPEYPQDRTEYVIENAKLTLLITQNSLLDRLPKDDIQLICVDGLASEIAQQGTHNPAIKPQAEQPMAYAIYTSGSTGKPKGVAIAQQAFINFLYAMESRVEISGDDVLLAVTTLSFDIAGLEVFLPLLLGGEVVIASRMDAMDDQALARLLDEKAITVLQATPATWHLLINSGWSAPSLAKTGLPLKGLCGGEPLPPKLANDLLARGVDLHNVYGPTETTVWSTSQHITETISGASVSIGRPLANTSLYILDAAMQPVPAGISGELWIGGDGVAFGYLGREDLTREAFVANPFKALDPTASERIYRTGDLARYLPDGRLECQGRIDNQVKVRGFRIELGEIETILNQHKAIKEGVVHAIKGDDGNAILAGYAVLHSDNPASDNPASDNPAGNSPVSIGELQTHLRQTLPEYMVPTAFMFLEAMPLTPNGKVDRKALPKPQISALDDENYLAPRNDTEAQLQALWNEVLKQPDISVVADFFTVGGQSLLATQLAARIRNTFNVDFSLRELFEHSDIESQAQLLLSKPQSQGDEHPAMQANSAESKAAGLPLSFNQQRLWLVYQIDPASPAYNMPIALRIKGSLNTTALEHAFQTLIARHDTLRTSFHDVEQEQTNQEQTHAANGAVQVVHPDIAWSLGINDIRADLDAEQINATAHQLALAEAMTPFDITQAPLMRTQVLKLAEDEHVLLCTLQHIISDGWSMELLIKELATVYAAACNDQPVAGLLPALPLQYADYAVWQRQWLQGEVLDQQVNYWTEQLSGAPALLQLPTDRPRPPVQTDNGAIFELTLSSDLVQQINTVSQHNNVTPFMVMLSTYSLLLSRYSGQNDICIGMPVAGRHMAETEPMIGFFVNALIVRTQLQDNPSVSQLFERVKEQVLGAFGHQDVPADLIIDALKVQRSSAYNPIAQVGFNYLGASEELAGLALGDLSAETLTAERVSAKYDMIWTFKEDKGNEQAGIFGAIEYNTDLFDRSTLATMSRQYLQLLASVLEHLDQPVQSLALVPTEQLFAELDLDPIHYQDIRPLTAMQSSMYFDALLNPDNRRESLGYVHHVEQRVDEALWQQTLEIVSDHFSTLRTRIISADKPYLDAAYAAIVKPGRQHNPISVSVIDRSDVDYNSLDQEAFYDELKEAVFSAYQLDQQPLFRGVIYRFAHGIDKIFGCAHHIILDGIGMQMYTLHCQQTYQALVEGRQVHLPEDQFAKYLPQERSQSDTALIHQFWQHKVQGVDALSAFVSPEKASQPGRFISHTTQVSGEHWLAIQNYCRKNRTTPTLYLKALYSLMLKAYGASKGTQQNDDFHFAEVMAGRPKDQFFELGCYFEQVPFIASGEAMSGDKTFKQLLKYNAQYRKAVRDAQHISFGLQHQLLPQGRAQYLFNFYPMPKTMAFMGQEYLSAQFSPEMPDSVTLIGRAVAGLDEQGKPSHAPEDSSLELMLSYTDNVFEDRRFIERLISLSQQITAGTERLGELNYLLDDERATAAIASGATGATGASETKGTGTAASRQVDYPLHNLALLIEQQVEATPDNIALECGEQRLSYRELDQRANQLANYLIEHHQISPGSRIAVCFTPGCDLMVAILASIKAGAAYIPVDPNYPRERVHYMLEDSQSAVLLSESCLLERLPHDSTRCALDTLRAEIEACSTEKPTIETNIDDLLYVIYTSGSTGQPKGAGVKHRGELNLLQWYTREFAMSAQDKALIISAIGFDLTQKNLFAPLCVGARVVFSQATTGGFDDAAIRREIADKQITLINCAPSAFYPLVENADEHSGLNSLRYVLFGGEPIRIEKLLPWLQSEGAQAQIINMYGPTECTDIATFYRLEQPDAFINRAIPIGQANDNIDLYVMDADKHLMPPGIPGELVIGGEGVGVGYLNKAELSEQVFFQHQGQTLYRTGDLVRQLDDGNLEFISRIDFQVKLRGLRIELGEIEHALRQLDGVSDSLALVQDEILVAYVTSQDVTSQDSSISENWRATLADYLPDYMLPQRLMVLDSWPLTPNGKIDRKALPAAQEQAGTPYLAPTNAIEQQLVDIWQQVLGLDPDTRPIGIHDNFFELGGHSLLATRAVSRVRESFEVELPLRDVFQNPTIAAIATLIELAKASGASVSPAITVADRSLYPQGLPLSFAQQRLWLIEQIQGPSAMYHMPMAVKISGKLNPLALEDAFNSIVERHEILRSRISSHDGDAVQIIESSEIWQLQRPQLKASDSVGLEALAKDLMFSPFALDKAPLFRVALVELLHDAAQTHNTTGSEQEQESEHVLLVCMHHIITDGWSMNVLLQELATLYIAYNQDLPSPLPALPVQYPDYAVWQRNWLTDDVLEQQISYWKEKLHNPPVLELALDHPRMNADKQAASNAAGVHHFNLPAQVVEQLKHVSQQHGTTLFMTTLAVFQLLLARHSRQDDIAIGTPIAGRQHGELEPLIGFFVNTLVIRSGIQLQQSFADFLQTVKTSTLEAYSHQDVPFERLVDELKLPRDLSHTPLFQAMFSVQNAAQQASAETASHFADMALSPAFEGDTFATTAKFDINMTLNEYSDGISAAIEYRSALFEADTIETLAERFVHLLNAACKHPEQAIGRLPLQDQQSLQTSLPASERVEYDHNATVHGLIEAQVERSPEAIALICAGESLSYAELNQQANQLAHHLIGLGVNKGDRVGICLPRSANSLIATLAVLKTGAAYVPMDASYPADRLQHMASNAAMVQVITSLSLQARFSEQACLCLDDDKQNWQQAGTDDSNLNNPNRDTQAEDLLYLVYTSGSTGLPKGAGVRHRNEVNLLSWYSREYAMTASDKTLIISALGFDLTQKNLFAPLITGGTVVLNDQDLYDPQHIRQLIKQHQISLINCAPSAFYPLVEAGLDHSELKSLRIVLFGGEPIKMQHMREWVEAVDHHCAVVNMYGPTECTDIATTYRSDSPKDFINHAMPIGQASANVELYILDENQQPLAPGIAGELCIGGDSVGTGYFNNPELTAAAFITKPFAQNTGHSSDIIYRTGDLVRTNRQGQIEYLGRIDQQVKIRGYRIELEEIEAVLNRDPAIKAAVVASKADHNNEDQLVAYFVAESDDYALDAIKASAKQQLPVFMLPAAFMRISEIPLTPNGKVDRKALPTPEFSANSAEYVAPQTPTEEVLAEIWQNVLGVARVGRADDFFALGGHSLLATKVAARLRDKLNVELPLRVLFEASLLSELAQEVEQASLTPPTPPIVVVDREQQIPLSYNQQQLWLMDQIMPGSAAYNMPMAARIKGKINVQAMGQAITALANRHEILRTTFQMGPDGNPFVIVAPENSITLSVENADSLDAKLGHNKTAAATDKLVTALAAQEASTPFSLSQGPLLRARLIELADQDYLLLASMHHIVSDGWSIDIIMRELGEFYVGYDAGITPLLSPLAVQYADFAHWQRNWLANSGQQHLQYWVDHLQGAPALLKLPTDRPRPPQQTSNGAMLHFELPHALTSGIKSWASEHNTTLFMSLLAAYQLLLSRYANQNDVCVGIPSAGRNRSEVENLIGYFVNPLVIRSDLSGQASIAQLLAQVKQVTLGAFGHQDVPSEMIIEALRIQRDPSYPPIAQVGFALQNLPTTETDALRQLGNLELELIGREEQIAKYDLSLFVEERGEKLAAAFEYNTDLFDASTIERMAQHFERLLEQMIATPNATLDSLQLSTEAELFELLNLDPANVEHVYPMSPAMRDFYLATMLSPDTLSNSNGAGIWLETELDVPALVASLQAMVNNFQMARCVIAPCNVPYADIGYIQVNKTRTVSLEVLDWSDRPNARSQAEAYLHTSVYRQWNIHEQEPLQFELVKMANDSYLLIAACNHIIFDGNAEAVTMTQALQHYEATRTAGEFSFEEDVFPAFIDQSRQEFDTAECITFWKDKLQSVEALDAPATSIKHEDGEFTALKHRLDDDHFDAIKKYCRKNRITPQLYFKAIFGLMVGHYCRAEEDFSFRDTLLGRPKGHMSGVGCYSESPPFIFPQASLKPESSCLDLFAGLRAFTKACKSYSQLSIMAQQQLVPANSLNFIYNFTVYPTAIDLGDHSIPASIMLPHEIENHVQFLITLSETINMNLRFRSSDFDDNRFLERMLHISEQLLQGTEQLCELSYLLPDEQQLLDSWNPIISENDVSTHLHQRFEQHAKANPDAIAASCGNEQISYRELNGKANQLARELQEQGVKRGTLVGLSVERSLDILIGVLGIIKAGGAYVPLDPHFPAERLAYILEDSEAPVLVTQQHLVDSVSYDGKRICLDSDASTLAKHANDDLNVDISPADTMYVIYTSGTTGKPKGCLINHGNATRLFSGTDEYFGFKQSDVWTLFHSYAFDFSVWEIWGAIAFGGKVVVIPYELSRAPDAFYQLLEDQQVTVLNQTPSAFSQIIALDADRKEKTLQSLRYVIFGGEALDFNALATWFARHGYDQPQLINMYGITETTVHVTHHRITAADMVSAKSNIGRPISDLHVHIVDKNRQPVALGLPGELVVAGRGVTDGYLKRPDLSAEKFVDNPFVSDQNDIIKAQYGKLYHSGDLARFMPNGDIEYLGRIDLQVKIRGHRIELGEIEAQLAALDEVREAVVLVREDTLTNAASAADKRLVGYLLAPPGQDIDISTVKQKLAVNLPDYMIPAAFVILDEWPLTPNGKVDKKALPAPDGSAESSVEYVAPRNDTEAAIALMWTELLGCQDPGVYDNFFDLGGHSLIAVRMVREIETRFEVALPITELFNAQTIAGMATLVERQHAPWSPIVPINAPLPGDNKAPLFLIHPVGGMVLCYQRLADAIGKNQPIYGIQASGFAADQTPFNSMEAMAAYYLEHIKTVQPEGPYYLGGQSLGGLIAFEVVRQLRARGDEVKLLVMMDSHRPSRLVRFGMNSDARFVQFFLNDIVGGLKLPVALLKGMDRDQLITKVTEHTQHLFSAELLHNMFGVIEGFRDILLSYKPGIIDVPIQLIRPQDELKGPLAMVQRLVKRDFSGKLGWHKHTSAPLTTTTVSGSHYSILQEPHVSELADVVRDILQQAQRETS